MFLNEPSHPDVAKAHARIFVVAYRVEAKRPRLRQPLSSPDPGGAFVPRDFWIVRIQFGERVEILQFTVGASHLPYPPTNGAPVTAHVLEFVDRNHHVGPGLLGNEEEPLPGKLALHSDKFAAVTDLQFIFFAGAYIQHRAHPGPPSDQRAAVGDKSNSAALGDSLRELDGDDTADMECVRLRPADGGWAERRDKVPVGCDPALTRDQIRGDGYVAGPHGREAIKDDVMDRLHDRDTALKIQT